MTDSVTCNYCTKPAVLVNGADLYPGRDDLAAKRFWRCAPCGAWVGCHAGGDGTVPLGRLADSELRRAKMKAHEAFDPLWQTGGMNRKAAYAWLAGELGIKVKRCHIGGFTVPQCAAVVVACKRRRAPTP